MKQKNREKRIYFHSVLKKYQVMIWYQGKNLHIGYRNTLDEAIALRDKTYIELGIKPTKDIASVEAIKDLDIEDQKLLKLQEELNEKGILP
jgi:hypothetical protein